MGGLSFRNNENLERGVFVFKITKTKTPKFTVKFDLKLSRASLLRAILEALPGQIPTNDMTQKVAAECY